MTWRHYVAIGATAFAAGLAGTTWWLFRSLGRAIDLINPTGAS